MQISRGLQLRGCYSSETHIKIKLRLNEKKRFSEKLCVESRFNQIDSRIFLETMSKTIFFIKISLGKGKQIKTKQISDYKFLYLFYKYIFPENRTICILKIILLAVYYINMYHN